MKLIQYKDAKSSNKLVGNQRGFVLILTMVMLAILSILGVMVLNTTDTELNITTNYQMNSDAFRVAELGIEYAKQKVVDEREDIADGSYILFDTADGGNDDDLNGLLPDGIELEASGRNEIIHYTGLAPSSMASQTSTDAYQKNIYRTSNAAGAGTEGAAAYYRVSVEATARGRSSARVETLFVNRGGQVF